MIYAIVFLALFMAGAAVYFIHQGKRSERLDALDSERDAIRVAQNAEDQVARMPSDDRARELRNWTR